MRIAISALSPEMNGDFDPRFGRCRYFILVDADSQAWEAVKNPGFHSSGGAGTSAAHHIARKGVDVIISGRFGPHACTALQAADIQMYQAEGDSVSSVFNKFQDQDLRKVAGATHRGQHRTGRRSRSR